MNKCQEKKKLFFIEYIIGIFGQDRLFFKKNREKIKITL